MKAEQETGKDLHLQIISCNGDNRTFQLGEKRRETKEANMVINALTPQHNIKESSDAGPYFIVCVLNMFTDT